MDDKLVESLKGQSAELLGPSRELNKLIISTLEQLTTTQLASLREYTELNLGQLKAAADISSTEDLKEFLNKQKDFLKTVGEKMAADAQALAAVGKEFLEEAQKISGRGLEVGQKGLESAKKDLESAKKDLGVKQT
jgi:phasin family protein